MEISTEVVARELLDVVPVIMRTIRTEMRSRRSADLSVPQFRTLLYLNNHPGASLSVVADFLGLTSPTVCKMIDGMVIKELMTRHSSPDDRRKIVLTLTEEGKMLLDASRNGTQAHLVSLLAGLSSTERTTIFEAINLLHPLFLSQKVVEEGER
jgi:DNA-binding MarR family transcriptional regulator